ncbi:MAG TPA: L-threonylcarbamoyladenylate synthase [Vicinamibacterales bacterium]|nr:L-threonylcarbamoyladenylate synthase [Vicinamibacterales bacterium]
MTDVQRVDPADPDARVIAHAAELLRAGRVVAFPTETVYGLGAHALDRAAILKVFAAKERPANDPLIVHVATLDAATPLVEDIPPVARLLAARFWPGPLTMVLKRSAQVPDEVTAGLATVAIRVPSHPVARALLEEARIPVAAPSANLFSRPSPTRAAHVLADLNGRIDLIVDGGATEVGLESTVIDLSGRVPTILRPGAIDLDALRQVIPDVISGRAAGSPTAAMASPGMLPKHYSPRTPVLLYEGDRESALVQMKRDTEQRISRGESIVVLSYTEDVTELRNLGVRILDLAPESNPVAVAARLYAALRECDELGAAAILVRTITTRHPLTGAIQDRLRRAATVATPDT